MTSLRSFNNPTPPTAYFVYRADNVSGTGRYQHGRCSAIKPGAQRSGAPGAITNKFQAPGGVAETSITYPGAQLFRRPVWGLGICHPFTRSFASACLRALLHRTSGAFERGEHTA